ncbi:MAG: hypothetical protein AAF583_16530 [Pseudomonadota bacterium]
MLRNIVAIRLYLASITVMVCSAVVMAEPGTEDQEPNQLVGDWIADCDAWGVPASCQISWSEGVHDAHLTISYSIANRDTAETIFRGNGVYRLRNDDLDGYWSDSGGAIHPLRASWADAALTTHWGRAGGDQGRTVYQLTDDGRLNVVDWSLQDEGWTEFMSVTYERSSTVPAIAPD